MNHKPPPPKNLNLRETRLCKRPKSEKTLESSQNVSAVISEGAKYPSLNFTLLTCSILSLAGREHKPAAAFEKDEDDKEVKCGHGGRD